MAPIAIDVGIGDTLQAINGILARRENERTTSWNPLGCELEAVSLTIADLDHMYFALLAEIEEILGQDQVSHERLNIAIEQATIYCADGRLLQRLSEWRGAIQSAAFSHTLKHRRYRALASTLRSIDEPLKRYIEHLYTLQNRYRDNDDDFTHLTPIADTLELPTDQRWNLATVLDLLRPAMQAHARIDDSGNDLSRGREACEEAIRNYDRALSLTLAHLVGHARQDLAMEGL
jgi:hypothetical protein